MAGNERFSIDVVLNDSNFRSGVSRMVSELNRVGQGAQQAGQHGTSMGSMFKGAFATMAGVGAAVAGFAALKSAVQGVVSVGMDYTKQMSKVEALSGSTSLQMAELGANARKLGAETKWSATNVAEAYEYMALAGWDSNQMLAASKPLLNLATAGALDLAKASDIVTDTMTPFGMKAEEAGRAADVFAVAQSKANLNVEQMGETMKYAAPIAATFGASLEDTSTIAMIFANSGIKASMAGTALRAGLSRLAEPPKPAAKALAALNVETKNADGTMKGLRDIIGELSPKFNELTDQQQIAAAKAIFGEEAYAGWVMVLKGGLPEFDRLHGYLDNSSGAAEKFAGIMANNLSGAMDGLKSQTENLGLVLFSQVEAGLVAATNGTNGWIKSLTDFIDPSGRAVEATKLMQQEGQKHEQTMALIDMQYKNGEISKEKYIAQMDEENSRYNDSLTVTGMVAQKKAELDAQVAAGTLNQEQANQKLNEATLEYQKLGEGIEQQKSRQEQMNQIWGKISEIMSQVWAVVQPIWQELSSFIGQKMQEISQFISENGENIKVVWNAIWTVVSFLVGGIWEGIKNIINGALNIVMGLIKVFGSLLRGDWTGLWEGIKQVAQGIWQLIVGLFEVGFVGKIISAAVKFVSKIIPTIGKAWTGIIEGIQKFLSKSLTDWKKGWDDMVEAVGRILSKVKDVVMNPLDTAKRALDGISWADAGKKIMQSLIDGIKGLIGHLGSAVGEAASALNPLNLLKAPDSPIGAGKQMQSPTGSFSGNARLRYNSPTGISQLNSPIAEVFASSRASSGSSIGSLMGIAQMLTPKSGGGSGKFTAGVPSPSPDSKVVVEVPVYLNDVEVARATADAMSTRQKMRENRKFRRR